MILRWYFSIWLVQANGCHRKIVANKNVETIVHKIVIFGSSKIKLEPSKFEEEK